MTEASEVSCAVPFGLSPFHQLSSQSPVRGRRVKWIESAPACLPPPPLFLGARTNVLKLPLPSLNGLSRAHFRHQRKKLQLTTLSFSHSPHCYAAAATAAAALHAAEWSVVHRRGELPQYCFAFPLLALLVATGNRHENEDVVTSAGGRTLSNPTSGSPPFGRTNRHEALHEWYKPPLLCPQYITL